MRVWMFLVVAGCTDAFGLHHIGPPADGSASAIDAPLDAYAPTPCLVESFDGTSLDTIHLMVTKPTGGDIVEGGGVVQVTWPASVAADNYGDINAFSTYDLRGGYATIDVDAFAGDTATAAISVQADPMHRYDIVVDQNVVSFNIRNGTANDVHVMTPKPYLAPPLTLRISHDIMSDMVTYSVTTQSMTWSTPIASAFSIQAVAIGFAAGSYGSAAMAGSASFDNLGVYSPACL